eukprot:m.24734 g.24734  ORF g.24734 m.24734 type:complete len:249 (+) comp11549_c1_seq1:54-800(+)
MEHNRVAAPSGALQSKLVRVEPESLLFQGNKDEAQRTITSIMKLYNKTPDHVAFKIKTTRPKGYCVRPNSGVISPKSVTEVEVTMQSFDQIETDYQKHKFQIQALPVEGGLSQDELAATFKGPSKNKAEEFKIKCAWHSIRLPDSDRVFSSPGTVPSQPVAKEPSPTPASANQQPAAALTATTTERRAQQAATREPAKPKAVTTDVAAAKSEGAASQSVAGVKSAPLNVVLVLVAFVLGIFFDRLILS